jgi:hypothetical protein
VGVFSSSPFSDRAFITGPNGEGITDLNTVVDLPAGIVLTHAVNINNAGQVIALAIPEPESYAMFLAGLSLVGFMTRRTQSRNRMGIAWK